MSYYKSLMQNKLQAQKTCIKEYSLKPHNPVINARLFSVIKIFGGEKRAII